MDEGKSEVYKVAQQVSSSSRTELNRYHVDKLRFRNLRRCQKFCQPLTRETGWN